MIYITVFSNHSCTPKGPSVGFISDSLDYCPEADSRGFDIIKFRASNMIILANGSSDDRLVITKKRIA